MKVIDHQHAAPPRPLQVVGQGGDDIGRHLTVEAQQLQGVLADVGLAEARRRASMMAATKRTGSASASHSSTHATGRLGRAPPSRPGAPSCPPRATPPPG